MKRILFFLSIAVLLTGCNKDKINFTEADLLGTWMQVKYVHHSGVVIENQALTMVLKNENHVIWIYQNGAATFEHWELQGRQFNVTAFDPVTITQLDGTHLTITSSQGDTETWIKIEPLVIGEWTAIWRKDAQYVNIKADCTSDWVQVSSGLNAGTYNWNIDVNLLESRPCIVFSGGWDDTETIYAASDNQFNVTNKVGGPGLYVRGKVNPSDYKVDMK